MALSVFGIARDQLAAAALLKPDGKDTNVSPAELAAYLRAQGLRARVVFGAEAATLRLLVAAGAPAIVEQWIAVEGRGEMGHYRVITGYQEGAFLAQDSYYGPDRAIEIALFEAEWRPFGRAMVVPYREDQEAAVSAALGPLADEGAMVRAALARQEAEDASIGDAWAHFALAEARARVGDWAGAAEAGDRAMAAGLPFRTLWYQFGYYRSLYETGRFQNLLDLCDRTLAPMKGEQLEETHYWRGMALRGLGREAEAVAAFQAALRFNPHFSEARTALGG
jgi:tetratricopeptide (TPR) repeat protein